MNMGSKVPSLSLLRFVLKISGPRFFLLLPLLLMTSLLRGQAVPLVAPVPAWITITAESSTVAVTLPAGTTYRFGDAAHSLWSAPITVTEATTFSPVFLPANVFPFADPDPGTVKELDVLQTASAQTIPVTNLAVTPAVTTAQVVPPVVPPTFIPVTPGTSYTLTLSNFTPDPTGTQSALTLSAVTPPAAGAVQADGATQPMGGTQMNLTIDGVTMVCTYAQNYANGVFSLNCTVPTS